MPARPLLLRPWAWRSRTYVAAVTALTLAIMLIQAWWVFDRIPHLVDAAVFLFEANGLSRGMVAGPTPPVPEAFFAGTTAMTTTEWYGVLPWGYPLLLVPGVWLGCPWVMNPIYGALTVPLLYYLGRTWFDRRTAQLAVLLVPLSPWMTYMAGTFMSHTATTFVAVLAWTALTRWGRSDGRGTALGCAIAVSWLGFCRPYTGAALAVPLFAYGIWCIRRRTELRRDGLLLMALVFTVAAMLFIWMLHEIGPKPHTIYSLDYNTASAQMLGFRWESGNGQPYLPSDGLRQLREQIVSIHRHLFAGPWPGLWVTVIPIAFLPWSRHTGDLWATAWALSVPIAYFFFFWNDDIYGARYLFEIVPALFFLTSRGWILLVDGARRLAGRAGHIVIGGLAILAVGCTLLQSYPQYWRKYAGNYVGPRDYVRSYAGKLDRALIFLDTNAPQAIGNLILAYDDPGLTRPILLAHDRKHANHDLARHFPEYPTFRYTILFDGDLQNARVVYEHFQPIDTEAELHEYLRGANPEPQEYAPDADAIVPPHTATLRK